MTSLLVGTSFFEYLNGALGSDTEPPDGNARVIEFALSHSRVILSYQPKIYIQDKTSDEFSRGKDTYNNMKCGKTKTLYWFENGMHFMARAEVIPLWFGNMVWRFVVQDFDPCSAQDVIIG